jgi:hypothetical protein
MGYHRVTLTSRRYEIVGDIHLSLEMGGIDGGSQTGFILYVPIWGVFNNKESTSTGHVGGVRMASESTVNLNDPR